MGHDISGFIKGQTGREIAYLRIGAFNTNKSFFFYDAIQSQECNGGVSGLGVEKTFTNEELKIAKQRLKYMLGESQEEVENLVLENTNDSVGEMKTLLEQTLGVDMGSVATEISEDEKVMIGESINEFLDKLIETGGDVEIYFG
jgi:hypothetical protein